MKIHWHCALVCREISETNKQNLQCADPKSISSTGYARISYQRCVMNKLADPPETREPSHQSPH